MMSEPNTEPQMQILERGRPVGRREDDWKVPVSTRLPPDVYDRLVKVALRQDRPVSELVRHILMSQSILKK